MHAYPALLDIVKPVVQGSLRCCEQYNKGVAITFMFFNLSNKSNVFSFDSTSPFIADVDAPINLSISCESSVAEQLASAITTHRIWLHKCLTRLCSQILV